MRIDQTYNDVTTRLRKRRNGFYPISQFNTDAPRAVIDAFNEYYEGYSATQKLHDALSPFKATPYGFTVSSSVNGIINLPSDYGHLLNISVNRYNNITQRAVRKGVALVNEDELDAALESQVRPVNLNTPIAIGSNKFIQLYPATPQTGVVDYLRMPKKPVYAYTTNGRRQVYDNVNSVDIEFSDLYMSNVIAKIVDYAAAYLQDKDAQQNAQVKQQQTV